MLLEQTLEKLRSLKLYGMLAAIEQQATQPEFHELSFEERLGFLVDREVLDRGNRRVTELLRKARLRQSACVENIDYQQPRGLEKSRMAALISCDFIRHHQNLLITGPTGCGKSWLACAIGQQACRQGISVRYIRVAKLLEELRISHADGTYIRLLAQLAKHELLILDDFGLDSLSRQDQLDLLEIIEDRHQIKSTLITSQLGVKHWHEYIGEPTIADAIIDRLINRAHQIQLKGESMRKEKKVD
ncbi:IS21-like element helper ATPase IstB [Legionella pneumophila]|uniref:IS21-like element helper ATPase IstB n=1 Tax=Legionella pneumophila TaxID=446 RepID=UPI0026E0F148|nr:IS21-like element helper ATPase IstB [Legionella pneumophila]MDO5216583.1 IS21-like element helper ATPase IstB [Legionella pneumophila]